MRKTLITTLVALTATGLTFMAPAGAQASAINITRLGGADRYATAVAISNSTFLTLVPADQFEVMIASGANFPDALAAGPAAASVGGPLLLVPGDGVLPASVSTEFARLNPMQVEIAGGTSSVSDLVQTQLDKLLNAGGSLPSFRLAGQNRYETAALIADSIFPVPGTVFISTGASFPDAVGGSAAAGELGGSLMLTDRSVLSNDTATELTFTNPSKVVILGGPAVVDPSIDKQIQAILPTATVERWSGADRYATAAEISRHTYPAGATKVYLASGASFPDALAGGPAAAHDGAPLLLTSRDCVPASTLTELSRLGATDIVVLGGTASVSDVAANLTPCP
jgi:putative cell wall-binding protein